MFQPNGHILAGVCVDPNWWKQAVVYQIYPRSFADANGDGIGDLKGITSRVPYLKDLGVDAIWLSPFYPSPLKDGGYDVSDYRDVDPRIGTLKDFEEMTSVCKEANIKVIIDIVPNHCSDEHPWFQAALHSAPGSKERARFHFHDGLGPDKSQPPADWMATFGGPMWTPTGKNDGQFYLHMYDAAQPDLNWSNPEVRDDFLKTFRFWGDRGVSGFRIDVATGNMKDLSDLTIPWSELKQRRANKSKPGNEHIDHPLFDRDENFELYKTWRQVFNEFTPPLTAVAEAFVSPSRKRHYASPEGLGQVFSFDILLSNFNIKDYKQSIERQIREAKEDGSSTTWVFSNHDMIRHHTRYGLPDIDPSNLFTFRKGFLKFLETDGKDPAVDWPTGMRRGRAATLMILALPGSTYIYQGEELGLPEAAAIPEDQLQDPYYFRHGRSDKGRDGCRVPIPWAKTGVNFGFGSGKPAHLPQPEEFWEFSVEAELPDPKSTLNMYRKALAIRRDLQTKEEMTWYDHELGDQVLAFERPNGWLTMINGGKTSVPLPQGKVLIASGDLGESTLPGETTVWIKRA
ncbi:hypothetical protein V866_003464 [Kwoniella sp. B9012]